MSFKWSTGGIVNIPKDPLQGEQIEEGELPDCILIKGYGELERRMLSLILSRYKLQEGRK